MRILIICLGLCLSALTRADFIIDSPLSFGEISIRNNNSVSSVTVQRSGATTSNNHIFIVKPGTPAVLTLTNMPGYLSIHLTADVPATSRMPYPNGAQFSITAVDLPSSINTGPNGTVQFKMGGTLSTSGKPEERYYNDARYEIFINLHLDY